VIRQNLTGFILRIKIDGKDRFYYQGVKEVTSMVKSGLSVSTYGVANLVTDIGMNDGGQYGAWSLVVIYKDSSASFKNLTAYDGYIGVSGVDADLGWNGVYNGTTLLFVWSFSHRRAVPLIQHFLYLEEKEMLWGQQLAIL
jgi:hypothetical protein